jgi:hypothetical protein
MAKGTISSAMPDLFPSPMYVAKVTAGATSGDVLITSSADYNLCDLPAGLFVKDVGWQVTTAFTANVDLEFGLGGDDPNGFAVVANVGAMTADTTIYWMSAIDLSSDANQPAYAVKGGALVPSTGDNLSITVNTATAATGVIDVYMVYMYADDLPNPDVNRWERLQRTHQFKAGSVV